MADIYDMNTLLPPEELQNMAQLWGSPAFYASDYASHTAAQRNWYIHLFTGRVPSPEEFYYGLYIDSRGDTVAAESEPLHLYERHLGYFMLCSNGYLNSPTQYSVGIHALANGAQLFEGATSVSTDYAPVQRNENSDLSWTLDWSFSASRAATLATSSAYTNLTALSSSGSLTHNRPTWFMISESSAPPNCTYKDIMHPVQNIVESKVSIARQLTSIERLPMAMGTVGTIGSGSDLEFATGADTITNIVAPVSLRVKCNAV